ncbi:MAG: cupin domain-containing protein, partial [Pseudomonadota bacterium]
MAAQSRLLFSGILPEAEIPGFLEADFEVRPRHFKNCPFPGFGFDLAAFFGVLRDTDWMNSDAIDFYENHKHRKFTDLNMVGIEYSGSLTLDILLMMKARKLSIYVRALQKRHQSLRLLYHSVAATGVVASHVNAFFSPASAQAAGDHWDNHDLIALQVAGRKEWNVKDAPDLEAVIHMDKFIQPADYAVTDAKKYILEPGDALYIPRGCGHNALALDEDSLHLVLGVKPLHWHMVLEDWVATRMLEDPALRRSVYGKYQTGAPQIDQDRLADVLKELTPDVLEKHIKTMTTKRTQRATLGDVGQTFAKDV